MSRWMDQNEAYDLRDALDDALGLAEAADGKSDIEVGEDWVAVRTVYEVYDDE